MSSTVTLHDLAERVGVHRSTVALALRGSSRISAEVRERVKQTAEQLGYRANPVLRALMQARRTKQKSAPVVLAYLTFHPSRYGWRPPAHDRPDYFPGACLRAEELGFRVDHFWYNEEGMTPRRFTEILQHRNITGLLIGRLPPGMHAVELPWEQFTAVALGMTLQEPQINRVAEDAFGSATTLFNLCRAQGHRRIGLVFSEQDDSPAMSQRYLSASLGAQLDQGGAIPPLKYPGPRYFDRSLLEWVEQHRPEVILATHAEPVRRALRRACPAYERLPIYALINDKPNLGFPGMHLDPAVIGGLAVEMIVGMLYRGEKGLPAHPHQVLVQSQWMEGAMLSPTQTNAYA